MWMIGIGLGAILLAAGFLTKQGRRRTLLLAFGAALLAVCLIYGGLVVLLLNGID